MRRARLARALLAGVMLALGLAAALAIGLWRDARPLDARAGELVLLIALGAFVSGALALLVTDTFVPRGSRTLRAGTAFLAVLIFGAPALVGFYGVHFAFNAYGELDFGDSLGWMHFAYASAQGMAYFVIFGFRLMWPWGMLAIAAVALLAAKRPTAPA